jgi:hypothetical protein
MLLRKDRRESRTKRVPCWHNWENFQKKLGLKKKFGGTEYGAPFTSEAISCVASGRSESTLILKLDRATGGVPGTFGC